MKFYGVGAESWSSGRKLAMQAQIPRLEAVATLKENPWGTKPMLSTDAFYDLVLAATGSEETARKKAQSRRKALIREGVEAT